ncbi:BlaI/MecI/CopY family transcriptional regulator [uncultured Muribaculum sp.]|uniref:BlaI/MecI/CopY family transcriptional regulator n=1 Tax=uncultured Muribaculum sp. TaxID=1918613 RepID=UPI0025B77A68|nr:BlaI/MecI/CopY family transcriptional regulator [uncultured Muribaculum sp.]
MKAGRKKNTLTDKEQVLMQLLWENGPMFVREMVSAYPSEPRPHFNTIATTIRILEDKGYVSHETIGASHRFFATAEMKDFRDRSLAGIIRDYFDNSYKNAVSSLVEDDKISLAELKEIIQLIELKNNTK